MKIIKTLCFLTIILSSHLSYSQTSHLDGETQLVNPTGRTLLIERDNEDSWLTFHDPGDHWFSLGVDKSNSGSFSLNNGGALTSSQFVMSSNGNIGIGISNPSAALHIDGKIMLNHGVIQRGGNPITITNDLGLYFAHIW